MAALSPLSERLSDRVGSRLLASGGMVVVVVGMLLLATMPTSSGLVRVMASLGVVGLGMAAFSAPNMSAIMDSVQKRQLGVASAFVGTRRAAGQCDARSRDGSLRGAAGAPRGARAPTGTRRAARAGAGLVTERLRPRRRGRQGEGHDGTSLPRWCSATTSRARSKALVRGGALRRRRRCVRRGRQDGAGWRRLRRSRDRAGGRWRGPPPRGNGRRAGGSARRRRPGGARLGRGDRAPGWRHRAHLRRERRGRVVRRPAGRAARPARRRHGAARRGRGARPRAGRLRHGRLRHRRRPAGSHPSRRRRERRAAPRRRRRCARRPGQAARPLRLDAGHRQEQLAGRVPTAVQSAPSRPRRP